MGKDQLQDLLKFMEPFPVATREIALWLRGFIWDLYPTTNELIYDNYNALAFGWSPTDRLGHTFCSIAMGRTTNNVHFGFYRGAEIADPDKILLGNGNQYRYVLVKDKNSFPGKYLEKLMKEAYVNSLKRVKDPLQLRQGTTIIKSVSPVQRKPGLKPKKNK